MSISSTNDGVDEFALCNELVCIDDDKLTIEIVSWMLRKSGHVCHLFTDPQQAMMQLRKRPPKLLIVDFYLPGITGLELVVELRKDERFKDTQIYLCSAISSVSSNGDMLRELRIDSLDKQVICDRKLLLPLLDKHLDQ